MTTEWLIIVHRPGGVRVTGWVATLLCGALAFLNAALATEGGFVVFFVVCGTVLVGGCIGMIARWYRAGQVVGEDTGPPA